MIDTSQCSKCINVEYNQYGAYCIVLHPLPQGDEQGNCNSFVPSAKTESETARLFKRSAKK